MAGPDKEDPVDTMAPRDIPAKASPPRENPLPPHKEEKPPLSSTAPPPDGGWGWVVVFASFMIHIIADGITYSFGVFLVELIDKFGADRGAASLIPSILVGVTLGSGPIASYFTNRYGCRAVTIAGAILASAGLALSCAANSIVVLYFTIGILTGLGFGLIYLPAIVSVSIYFEKKRAFATGIAVCGSGVGTFIMAPVTKGLISQFGWQGAMLVTSGLILSCILFGCLMRPIKDEKNQDQNGTAEEKELLTITNGKCQNGGPLPELLLNGSTISPMKPFSQQMGVTEGYSDVARMAMSHPAFLDQAERPQVHFGSAAQFGVEKSNILSLSSSEVMGRKDIFYSGSLLNIPEYKKDPEQYRRSMLDCKEEVVSPSDTESQSNICCIKADSKQAKILHQMLDFSLFKDPIFMMYATSNFLTSIGFNVPYVYTMDRAILWGMDGKDAAFLLSVIGISNTASRLILGWLSDRSWINRLYLYNSCLVVCGVSMALSPFCSSYNLQAVYCAIFGITSGAYVGLTSVVLVDLLGLEKLTNAFGLLLMFQGIASVIGPPVIGALYDSIGDYDAGFYFAGSMIFLSGAMLFAIPALQKHLASKRPSFKITSGKGQDDILAEA
eukprot:TRINITY_DN8647_c0_g1_i1.p1 TRINITY_DN8647_c0_g1~~TRINITY_DN8647_c0_g1_i1.p1  ORF type:complete len:613 (-),score=108.85 TRINITY_DN8647_c0_g1_i1:381-2219(-)